MDRSEIDRTSLRDLTSDSDHALLEYGKAHINLNKNLRAKGLYRSQSLAFFNDSYRLGRDVRSRNTIFTYPVSQEEQNSFPEFGYLHRVLKLCSKTDICSKLGLSIVDFMNMDLNTYTYIEEYYNKVYEKESKMTEEIMKNNSLDIKDIK